MILIRDNELSSLLDCKPGALFRHRGEPGTLYALVSIDYGTYAYTAVPIDAQPDGCPDRTVQLTDGREHGNAAERDVYLYRFVYPT